MSFVLWSFIALAIILSAGSSPSPSEQKAGLPLSPALHRPVHRRLRAQARTTQIGGLIGLGLGAALILLLDLSGQLGSLVVLTALLGMACGGAGTILLGRRGLLPGGPRVARLESTQKSDYVPEGLMWAARMGPPLAAAAVVLAWAALNYAPFEVPQDGTWWDWMTAAWVSLPVLALCWPAVELTAAAVLRRPRYAGSELELAWDDCCRSEALRHLYVLPAALSGLTCLLAFIPVGLAASTAEVREDAMDETLLVASGMFFVTLLLVGIFLMPLLKELGRGPHRHVLRRRWAGTDFTAGGAEADPADSGTTASELALPGTVESGAAESGAAEPRPAESDAGMAPAEPRHRRGSA